MIRSLRRAEGAIAAQEAGNALAWASCCRALLEAIGDSLYTVVGIPLSIANYHIAIRSCIGGTFDEFDFRIQELEANLIHFTHARRLTKSERDDVPLE